MDSWLAKDLQFVKAVSEFRNDVLDVFFRAVTVLGDEIFFVATLPLLMVLLKREVALRFAQTLVFAIGINVFFKNFFQWPRPYHLDPGLNLIPAKSFGFPSGHTQGTLVYWGMLFSEFRKRALFFTGLTIFSLVALSRVYLGVHFFSDLAGGCFLGFLVLWFYWTRREKISVWLESKGLVFILAIPLFLVGTAGQGASLAGVWLGIGFGSRNLSILRSFRLAVWMVLSSLLVYISMKWAFSFVSSDWQVLARFIRYFVFGAWISYWGFVVAQIRSGER